MKLNELRRLLDRHPTALPRFVLPTGDSIPAHTHITEVGHLDRNFVDCGGVTGKEEKLVLQTHVGDDTDHRLRANRFAKILQLRNSLLPNSDLDVEIEFDCCVVSQYPITDARADGQYLELMLGRGRTQCRARARSNTTEPSECRSASCC